VIKETELEFLKRILNYVDAEPYVEERAGYLEQEIEERLELLTKEEEEE